MKRPWYKKWTIWAVAVFVVIFVWGLAQEAEAGEFRLGVGKGTTNDNDWIGQELMLTDRDWYLSALKVGNDDRQPDTWRIAAGYRVDWREENRVAPYMRLGVAYWLDEPFPLISDQLTYDMAAGARLFRVLDIEWQHNSTAGRSEFNQGNDMIVIAVVFEF